MERYLLLKQQTSRMRIGPLCAKEKHLYISSTYCMTNKYSYNLFKKKKRISRNKNVWHVLVQGTFFKNLVAMPKHYEDINSIILKI